MASISRIEAKKVIFVDFFDTIMHRHIHALAIKAKRKDILGGMEENILPVEKYLEIGCQYPDTQLIRRLKKYKERGKRIYIVSDFQMGKDCYIDFLTAKNIDPNLFDDIFISCECAHSKAKGDLYPYVLDKIGAKAEETLMIGDNRIVDGKNAKLYGIDSIIIPHYCHKAIVQLKRFLKVDYSRVASKSIRKDLYRFGSPFSEYALLFYLSSRELYRQLIEKKQSNVVFLAREGHFLKRAFEAYEQALIPEEEWINTAYLKCSRRAAKSLSPNSLADLENTQISIYDYLMAHGFSKSEINEISSRYGLKDEIYDCSTDLCHNLSYLKLIGIQSYNELIEEKRNNNLIAGKQYFDAYDKGECLNLVDIGWRGRMQDTIGNILGKKTMGYYVGLNDSELDLSNRKGLLFNSSPIQGVKSPWSQILKANIQLYEQLTAAPHGSAVGYTFKDGQVEVVEDWVDNEKTLFCERIGSIQKELLLNIQGLAVWCDNITYRKLLKLSAKTVLRSGLFADDKRLDFLSSLDKGFVWNFDKQEKGLKYKKEGVKIKLDIITSPENYTRYFVKIQRGIARKGKLYLMLYYPLAIIIYGYIWGISILKNQN